MSEPTTSRQQTKRSRIDLKFISSQVSKHESSTPIPTNKRANKSTDKLENELSTERRKSHVFETVNRDLLTLRDIEVDQSSERRLKRRKRVHELYLKFRKVHKHVQDFEKEFKSFVDRDSDEELFNPEDKYN